MYFGPYLCSSGRHLTDWSTAGRPTALLLAMWAEDTRSLLIKWPTHGRTRKPEDRGGQNARQRIN